jgi:hypothetical protein
VKQSQTHSYSQAADKTEAEYYEEKVMIGDFDDKFDSHAADRVEAKCLGQKADATKQAEDVEDWDDDDELLYDGMTMSCLNPGCKVLGCHIGCYMRMSHGVFGY